MRKTGRSLQKPRLMRTEQGKVDAIIRKYSKAAGLPEYKERMAVSGNHKVKTTINAANELALSQNSGTIKYIYKFANTI